MKEDFLQAFDQYGDAIFRFCMVKTSNKEMAEDLTQETFMRFWRAQNAQQNERKKMKNTRAYLYTIAGNLVIDWYRKKKTTSLDARMEAGFDPADEKGGTNIEAEHTEALECLKRLPEEDREILLLRYVEGLPPKEISRALDVSANVVSVRINRATKRLREKMEE